MVTELIELLKNNLLEEEERIVEFLSNYIKRLYSALKI